MAFTYAPGRSRQYADKILQGFSGTLQVDGYAGYHRLLKRLAQEGLTQIQALCRIEKDIRGLTADQRHAARQARSKPIIDTLAIWLAQSRARVSAKSPTGEALKYIAKDWDGLCPFLSDGCIELDNNAVERTIRPIALNRKMLCSPDKTQAHKTKPSSRPQIETCQLNGIEPHGYLSQTLTAIAKGHKQADIKDLLPWNYVKIV